MVYNIYTRSNVKTLLGVPRGYEHW